MDPAVYPPPSLELSNNRQKLAPETEARLEEIFGSAPHDQYSGMRIGYGHEPEGW